MDNKLLLFSNQNAKNTYIESIYNNRVIDTTNIQTMAIFFRSIINNYEINNNLGKTLISKDIATIYLAHAFEGYIKKNKDSIFYGQPNRHEIANTIYALYSHIAILENEFNFNLKNYSKSLEESIIIIDEYKKVIDSNDLYDECMLYSNFINDIKNNNINKSLLNYDSIEVYGFDHIPKRYSIFLNALKDHLGIKINIVMPYDINMLDSYLKSEYITENSKNLNISHSNISNFAKALINLDDSSIKNYKNNIALLSGFGESQEIDNVLDTVASLIENGVSTYNIAIISSDNQKYNDEIIEKCKDYDIPIENKNGVPLWAIPIIPIMTSVFSIFSNKRGGAIEINVDELLKLLSSPYVKIEFVNKHDIRSIFYSKNGFNFNNKMPLNDFIYTLKKHHPKEDIRNTASSILALIEKIKTIYIKDSFSKISSLYLALIKSLNVAESLKENDSYFHRDYMALSLFISTIISISIKNIKIDAKGYNTILNIIIRSLYIFPEETLSSGVRLLSPNEIIASHFSHVFILGMNRNLLTRNVDTFIVDNLLREKINEDLKTNIFETKESANTLSKSAFFSLLASFSDETNVYFSFMYKDNNGNLELPSSYLEELFLLLSNKIFTFENLKNEGLIYRKNYIEKGELAHSYKEKLMSLFYYKKSPYRFDDENIDSIIESVYKRNIKNETDLLESKEISERISKYFLSKNMWVKDIEDIMICPQYFIDKKIMGEIDDSSNEAGMGYQDKGIHFHKVYEYFYKALLEKYGTSLLNKNREKEYNNIASSVISEMLKNIKSPNSIDIKSLESDMIETLKLYIEKECLNYSAENIYMPAVFEKSFTEYEIYSTKDFSVKVSGRIDRVDTYKENDIVKGLRVVDYKPRAPNSPSKISSSGKEIILTEYLQPLIYLSNMLSENQKDNELIRHVSIAFSIYKKSDIINNKYFYEFNNRDILLELLGYIESDDLEGTDKFSTLKKYLSSTFDNFYNGIIDYNPNIKSCAKCTKKNRCTHVMTDDMLQ